MLAVFTQLVFLLNYFKAFATHKSKSISAEYPGLLPVSVLIIARNESQNFRELLPLLLNQDYPEFEIFILDDCSSDDTAHWLPGFIAPFPKIRFYRLNQASGKKSAMDQAIHHLSHELVLLTDADCRPASSHWISLMVEAVSTETEAVLGYSPYFQHVGWLNELLRLETAYTASIYFSFALKHHPYMGVGRNLLYRKQSLIRHFRPFGYPELLSGDDDLTINAMDSGPGISIQYDPASWVFSIPKKDWNSWLNQKKRHVSTARYYKSSDQIQLITFYSSLVISWLLAFGLGFINPWIWAGWIGIKAGCFMGIINPCLNKLGVKLSFLKWLRAEAIYTLGLIYLFPFSTGKKWNKW